MKRSALLTTLVLALASGGWGCSPRVDVGSSLRWFAQHETGDFSEWTAGYKGGCSADPPDTSVVISTDVAHSGTHSVKLANAAPSVYETARLWRQDDYPQEAYYSAWFYLPQAYRTTEDWTIMQFQVPPSGDAGTNGLLVDVDLRSLPGGEMILDVFDHRGQYLRSPTAEPALPVPIAAWFQNRGLLPQRRRRHGPVHPVARRASELRHPPPVRPEQRDLLVALQLLGGTVTHTVRPLRRRRSCQPRPRRSDRGTLSARTPRR